MRKNLYPPIFDLCHCGCNEIVWNGNKWIKGHYNKIISYKFKGKNNPFYGKFHTLTTKEIMSKNGKGKNSGDKNPAKNPEVGKKISKSKKEYYKNLNPERKEELRKKNSEGYKGKIPWNKGISPLEETKQKISIANKGKTSYWKGKKRPDLCGNNNPSCRPEVRKIKSEKLRGEKNGSWKGGVSYLPYCQKFNNKKREEVRELYGRKCFACGKSQLENITKSSGKQIKLSVHHIDMDKEQGCNEKGWKLIPLCIDCHENFHWQKLSLILKEYHEIPN